MAKILSMFMYSIKSAIMIDRHSIEVCVCIYIFCKHVINDKITAGNEVIL